MSQTYSSYLEFKIVIQITELHLHFLVIFLCISVKLSWSDMLWVCLIEGLSLLGAYEDSEEEDASEASSSAAKSKLNRSADIDSTLASFMAVSNILLNFSDMGH